MILGLGGYREVLNVCMFWVACEVLGRAWVYVWVC